MDNTEMREIVILGAGPGGYAAAFYAADLGMKVTLIDQEKNPGGVCLHRGCIPSKALLHAVKILREAQEAAGIGIQFGKPDIDLAQLRTWKESVVEKLTGGLGQLCRQRSVEYIQGTAKFANSQTIHVNTESGPAQEIAFTHCILATGSRPMALPGIHIQSEHLWDSTDALALQTIPEKLLVIGAGYIGMELGSVYAGFGSEVTVVEMLPQIMPGMDRDLVQVFQRRSGSLFKDILLQSQVTEILENQNGLQVSIKKQNGETVQESFDKVLISIGRRPNSENVGLENTQAQCDERGFVSVQENFNTDDPAIYAIGDLIGGPLLAHKASHEARAAVDAISGKKDQRSTSVIPGVVYTDPEIAVVGLSETEAKEKAISVKVLKFPWAASGRALTMNNPIGATKLIVEESSGRILGAGIAGEHAGEMISECTLAIEQGLKAEDLAHVIHPHPTLSETIMETAEMLEGTATHIYRPKRR